jgi:hypothetical protein
LEIARARSKNRAKLAALAAAGGQLGAGAGAAEAAGPGVDSGAAEAVSASLWKTISSGVKKTSFTCRNLNPATEYNFRVVVRGAYEKISPDGIFVSNNVFALTSGSYSTYPKKIDFSKFHGFLFFFLTCASSSENKPRGGILQPKFENFRRPIEFGLYRP